MVDSDKSTITLPLSARLEALLFCAPGSVTVLHLANALGISTREAEAALEELETYYAERGLRLQKYRNRYQLTTAPELAELVETFLGLEVTTRLSRPALEALSIIAYQQPVTRPQVDEIRGVNSDSVLKTLLSTGLVQEVGRGEGPGRPILYATTSEFLQQFGLNSMQDLPPLNLPEEEDGTSEGQDGDGGSDPEQNGRPGGA